MSMHWTWNGWTIRGQDNGDLTIESPVGGGKLGSDQIAAFADMLVACSTLLESLPTMASNTTARPTSPRPQPVSTPTATAPIAAVAAPTTSNEAPAPAARKVAPVAAKPAKAAKAEPAEVGSADTGRSRQGTTLRVDGQPVKRGPKAAAARFEAGDAPSPAPAPTPKAAASASAAAATSAPASRSETPDRPRNAAIPKAPSEADSAEMSSLPSAVHDIVRGLDPRARLLRPLIIWMAGVGRGVTMDEIIAAAIERNWSSSTNPQPAINASMQKHAHLFIRDQLGAFTLRAGRPEGKIIRRRSAVTSANGSAT